MIPLELGMGDGEDGGGGKEAGRRLAFLFQTDSSRSFITGDAFTCREGRHVSLSKNTLCHLPSCYSFSDPAVFGSTVRGE